MGSGLIWGGMIAGAGQAAERALARTHSAFLERDLVAERARLDDLRMKKQNEFAKELSDANILSRETMTREQMTQTDEHFKKSFGVEKDRLATANRQLATSATSALPLGDGTVALYSTLGGNPTLLGLLSDKQGPIRVGTDMTKRDQGMMTALTNVLVHKIDESKSPSSVMWTDDQRASHTREVESLLQEIKSLGSDGKGAKTAFAKPIPEDVQAYYKKATGTNKAVADTVWRNEFGTEPPSASAAPNEPFTPEQDAQLIEDWKRRQAQRGQ